MTFIVNAVLLAVLVWCLCEWIISAILQWS